MTGDELRHQSLLLDQLADERARKGSIEQRGIAVISTSGTLVAVTLGFVGLASRGQSDPLPPAVVPVLLVALAGLVAASATGLLVNIPARTPVVDADDLASVTTSAGWDATDQESTLAEYRIQVRLLVGLRKLNRTLARMLVLALVLEVVALLLMATSTALALWPMR